MGSAAQREELAEQPVYAATGTENAGALRQSGLRQDDLRQDDRRQDELRQMGAGLLQREAAARLAAHRSRKATEQAMKAALAESARAVELGGRRGGLVRNDARSDARSEMRQGVLRVREAVAARYEQSVSYREFLAAEADRALQQAQAEAEVAARKARAVAEAQMQLIEELEQWNRPEPGPREAALAEHRSEVRAELSHALADIALGAQELMRESQYEQAVSRDAAAREAKAAAAMAETPAGFAERASWTGDERESTAARAGDVAEAVREVSLGGLRVRLFEDFGATRPASAELRMGKTAAAGGDEELQELEQEIEFRMAPEFEPPVEAQPIPGNLIEFPRQLVASRKARPRLAEGPLREDGSAQPQLRIFEVEPEAIGKEPILAESAGAPDWQSLLLDYARTPSPAGEPEAQQAFSLQPQTAPLRLRLLAATVDCCCVGAALAGFAAVVLELAGKGMRGLPLPLLGASAASVLLVLFVGYQVLCFSLNGATPGMRVARIGLCTFGDRNPSRKAMRRRVLATLLAACPLGLGLAWACMDDERLGWHDRMSRMYQRAY